MHQTLSSHRSSIPYLLRPSSRSAVSSCPTAKSSLSGATGKSHVPVPPIAVTYHGLNRIYYLDPFNYLMSSLLIFTTWDTKVTCHATELAFFDPPQGATCQEYLAQYQEGMGVGSNLLNPDAESQCQVCQFTTGADYLRTLNLPEKYYGWRNAAIVVLFSISSYALVYLMMKLRTKATKRAT